MPTIEFTAYNDNTLKDRKPVLASKVQPEWWKKMKINEIVRGDKQQTIRACPAMQDWLTMGYYLISEQDILIQIGSDTHDESAKRSAAWSHVDPKIGSIISSRYTIRECIRTRKRRWNSSKRCI